jgi:Asp-tRNA(Asn)/Glu-tRNA(Gln) amidotransferase C subunit
MIGLSNQEVHALGRAVGLDIQEPELSQVAYSLNAILELMEEIDVPGVNAVEPLPIILPQEEVYP